MIIIITTDTNKEVNQKERKGQENNIKGRKNKKMQPITYELSEKRWKSARIEKVTER